MHGGFSQLARAALWIDQEGQRATFTLALRLVLVGLFGLAGTTKLRLPDGAANAAVLFGVLRRPRRGFALSLGVAELAAAMLLLTPWQPSYAVGVCAAGALSLSFAFVLARSLRAGERFECRNSCQWLRSPTSGFLTRS